MYDVKTLWQYIKQKTTDKFHSLNALLLGFACVSIFIGKADKAFIQGYNTVV